MGNSLVTPSSRAPGSALPSGAINGQAESSMSNREAPSHVPALKSRALGPMGVAESRDSAPTVTPRQVQIADSPSRSKASGTGGWVADESGGSRSRNDANARKSLERKSVELFEAQMSKKLEVEKSGRSIARRDSKDIERATPEEALQDLLDGNARFMIGESDHPHQNFQRMQKIAPKQKPTVAILACADSRVPVELIFDMGFGDVFVCRIAGNIATAEEIASLEYAVIELGVKVILVMGHTSCGAVKAALSGKAFPGFIDSLVDHIDVAVVRGQSRNASSYAELLAIQSKAASGPPDPKLLDTVIRENALYQVARCKRSTIILESVKNGNLIVVPAVYDIKTGEVIMLERQ